jgi:hypothetical protein
VGSDSRHTLEGGVDAEAERVETSLGSGADIRVIDDEFKLGGLLAGHTLEGQVGSGRRRVNKESKGRVRLVQFDIGVSDTDVGLWRIASRTADNGGVVLEVLGKVNGRRLAGENLGVKSRALGNFHDSKDGGVAKVHVDARVPASVVHTHIRIHALVGYHDDVGLGVLLHLILLAAVGVGLLRHSLHGRLRLGLGLLGLLLLLLRLLREGGQGVAHVVEERGEVGRSQEHAGEVVQAGIFFVESAVLETHFMGLVGAGGHLAFELTNVF